MKTREAAATAARLAVGAVMIAAGLSKAAAPAAEFALVIQTYGLLSPSLALPAAGILPWIEIALGWALVLGVETRLASAAAGGLFAVFLAALASVLVRGVPIPNCGCFGSLVHFSPAHAFLFDSVLVALCWTAFKGGPGRLSLDSWSERGL
jgi:uncharacterized membrane protein YphA (DoxX/SURF4 family)